MKLKLQRKYQLDASQASELISMLQDARGEGVQIGAGLFSKALNLIKKTNNAIHDIPIKLAKPVEKALKKVPVVGKIAGKVVHRVAQIASLAPPFNPDWDYKWRSKQSKENHALLHDGPFPVNSRLYRAKYAGPGTALTKNIMEDIAHYGSLDEMLKSKHWLTLMDKEGLAHDIRYALASIASNPGKAVVKADKKFIKVGTKLLGDPREQKLNVLGSLAPIGAKYLADGTPISDPKGFLDKNKDGSLVKPDKEDVKLYNQVLKKLSQQGFGDRQKEPNMNRPLRLIAANDKIVCEFCKSKLQSRNMRNHQLTAKKCLLVQGK